jgi:lipoprotein-anchoring transpeptidase ErfK/SrfK
MRTMRVSGALVALVFLFNAACVPQPTGTTQQPATNATNTAPAPTKPVSAQAEPMPVTLPVLEALFYDEAFANEVKSTLQLTDEQLDRLKTIAREAREGLREGATDDEHEGTTSEAKQRAEERIKEAIGEEKTQQLFQLAGQRWAGAAEEIAGMTKPGTLPADTRIVVNAPAYRMDVFDNGRLVKSYKVGIGYPEFPLPTGLRKADTIIFNPTWTPPDEPWVESSNKVKVGETIKAGDERNPLGPVKIPIGLPSLIHGGKSPSKLGGFASHGCVGLTTPQVFDLSKLLARLGGTELPDQQIAEYQKNKTETKNVKLGTPIPVELRYETITVEDGKLHVYRDVYDRNTNTEENLRAVLEAYGLSLDQLSESERAAALDALQPIITATPVTPIATAAPTPTEIPPRARGTNRTGTPPTPGRLRRR